MVLTAARGPVPQREDSLHSCSNAGSSAPRGGVAQYRSKGDGAVAIEEGVAAVPPGARRAAKSGEMEKEQNEKRRKEQAEEERHGIKIGYEVAGVYVARAAGALPSTGKIPLPPLYYMVRDTYLPSCVRVSRIIAFALSPLWRVRPRRSWCVSTTTQ